MQNQHTRELISARCDSGLAVVLVLRRPFRELINSLVCRFELPEEKKKEEKKYEKHFMPTSTIIMIQILITLSAMLSFELIIQNNFEVIVRYLTGQQAVIKNCYHGMLDKCFSDQ